jgi:hypothetical protein
MTTDIESKEARAGKVLTGLKGFDFGLSGTPYTASQTLDILRELEAMVIELKERIDKIENNLDFHVHLVGNLPHNI